MLALVSNDVKLLSSRDGEVNGKKQFSKYLSTVKPTGAWNRATWDFENQQAEIKGTVRVLFVNVNVVAHFGFHRNGKINSIYVGTTR